MPHQGGCTLATFFWEVTSQQHFFGRGNTSTLFSRSFCFAPTRLCLSVMYRALVHASMLYLSAALF